MATPFQRFPVHGEFASSDASGLSEPNSRFTLYAGGTTTSITLGANDQVEIDAVNVNTLTALALINVYDGADNAADAGEKIFTGIVAANCNEIGASGMGYICQPGSYPKVKTSASGQVYATLYGYVIRPAA